MSPEDRRAGSKRHHQLAAPRAIMPTKGILRRLQMAWKEAGWRRSALAFSIAALVTFAINLFFTLWATFTTKDYTIAEKDCSSIKTLSTGVHVLINGLSAVLLAGSNYCMQCLSAPTRSEIDSAHRSRQWLDIGVSSVRNIVKRPWGRGWWRVILWLLLGLSSLPLHLLYNSAVFQSTSINDYEVWLMSDDWIKSNDTKGLRQDMYLRSKGNVARFRTALSNGALERLDVQTCVEAYSTPFQSSRSHLILVTTHEIDEDSHVLGDTETQAEFVVDDQDRCGSMPAYQWMCKQYQLPSGSANYCEVSCDELLPLVQEDSRNGRWMPFHKMRVDYCYSLPSRGHCKLQFSRDLLIVVTALNLVKAALMMACVFSWRDEQPLMTVGDAIASFVDRPDLSTEGMCLLARSTAERDWTKRLAEQLMAPPYRVIFDGKRQRRWSCASVRKWTVATVILSAAVMTCVGLLIFGIVKIKGQKDFATLIRLGLGAVHAKTVMNGAIAKSFGSPAFSDSARLPIQSYLARNAVLANTPQVIFSLVYFSINGLFTTMSLATEWSRFGLPDGRKGLRRSAKPKGQQRSTYFLQLPYRLALPLLFLSGSIHWLISQSLFVVYMEAYTVDLTELASSGWSTTNTTDVRHPWEERDGSGSDIVTCGWSPVGVVVTASAGVLLMLVLLGFGSRKLPTGMPVAGSCSAAIAAACHPPPARSVPWQGSRYDCDSDAEIPELLSERRLQWGETAAETTNDGRRQGHCSFSVEEVRYPSIGGLYS